MLSFYFDFRWLDDQAFGLQRLAGVNNISIRRCQFIPKKFAVTDEMVEPFLEGLSLSLALSDRRIFIVDHEILRDCPTVPDTTVCAPIAMFFEKNDGTLIPIAIQLFQDKLDDNPVFLPTDPTYTWTLAKMWFNNADACVHQAAVHLAGTHLIMEGIAIVTNRHISQSHPLFKLLRPHLHNLLATNSRAFEKLLAPVSGWIEGTMSIGVEGFYDIIKKVCSTWRMDVDGLLPEDLRSRGVEDSEILKHYFFREDAGTVFEVIRKYVDSYLRIYYTSDSDVTADTEVQNWREEMVKPSAEGGLGLNGVPGDSDLFTSKRQLSDVCCCIIYTCTVGNCASKFKQYDEYAFTPNYPAKLCGEPPRDKSERTEEDVLAVLPDKATILETLKVIKIISQKHSASLGHFEINCVYDPKGVKVIKEFREDLKKASGVIRARNKIRVLPFPYLDPTEVQNNICI